MNRLAWLSHVGHSIGTPSRLLHLPHQILKLMLAKEAERVVPRLLIDVLGWRLLAFAALLWGVREIVPDLALGHKLASGNSRIV